MGGEDDVSVLSGAMSNANLGQPHELPSIQVMELKPVQYEVPWGEGIVDDTLTNKFFATNAQEAEAQFEVAAVADRKLGTQLVVQCLSLKSQIGKLRDGIDDANKKLAKCVEHCK